MVERERVRVGIIGAGRIGRLHAGHLASRIPEARLVAIADVNREAAARGARDYGIEVATDDYRELLALRDLAAVVVCSSTDTHAPLIAEAAAAGKHVFCEKPIALDRPATVRAIEAVAATGVRFQVGFHRRYDPDWVAATDAFWSDG